MTATQVITNELSTSNIIPEGKNITICLCMIVKNESKIIHRCLESTKNIVDYISICDTGSNDGTAKLIRKWCKRNKIPGTVHYEPFKNFSHNRTVSVNLAKKTYPQATYILLLDADMILEVDSTFNKSKLVESEYRVYQYNRAVIYPNTRLIKTSLDWVCTGVTHEYWECTSGPCTKHFLEGIKIDDREDGGSKEDKFERDKRLLTEAVNDPTTPPNLLTRYLFYLAQTYRDLKDYENAIIWYKKRIDAQGWEEEVFYSLYQIGLCYESLYHQHQDDTKLSLALYYYLESWQYRPSRAEPLYQVARLYRTCSKHNLAVLYALKAKEIPYPKSDLLFIDFRVYDYLIHYELSISCYYVQNKRDLGKSCLHYLFNKINTLPDIIKQTIQHNLKFYV